MIARIKRDIYIDGASFEAISVVDVVAIDYYVRTIQDHAIGLLNIVLNDGHKHPVIYVLPLPLDAFEHIVNTNVIEGHTIELSGYKCVPFITFEEVLDDEGYPLYLDENIEAWCELKKNIMEG